MEPIYFVTSNARKVQDIQERLTTFNVKVETLGADLDEIQHLSVEEVAQAKLHTAIEKYPGRRLLVDDRGLMIHALSSFPGAYLKPFLQCLTNDDILRLMHGKADRSVKYLTVLGYYDGTSEHFFFEEEHGFIANTSRGENLRGWNEFLKIYGHTSQSVDRATKTLAEYSDEEWADYLKELEANDCVAQFARFVSK